MIVTQSAPSVLPPVSGQRGVIWFVVTAVVVYAMQSITISENIVPPPATLVKSGGVSVRTVSLLSTSFFVVVMLLLALALSESPEREYAAIFLSIGQRS